MASQNPTTIRLAKLLPHWTVEPPIIGREFQPDEFILRPKPEVGPEEINLLQDILRALSRQGKSYTGTVAIDKPVSYVNFELPQETAQALADHLAELKDSPFTAAGEQKTSLSKKTITALSEALKKYFGPSLEVQTPATEHEHFKLTVAPPGIQALLYILNKYDIELEVVGRDGSYEINQKEMQRMVDGMKKDAQTDRQMADLLQECNSCGHGKTT